MASVFAHLVPCECEPEVCDIPVIVFDIGHVLVQLGVKGGKLVHIRIVSCRLIRTRHLKIQSNSIRGRPYSAHAARGEGGSTKSVLKRAGGRGGGLGP